MSHTMKFLFLFVACFVLAAYADDIVIKVSNFKYDPQTVNAKKGDVLVYTFDGTMHDVIQSDAVGSCTASTKITNAFKSTRMTTGTWNYTVSEDANTKIWYFCSVGTHCSGSKMYGTVNVVSGDSSDTPSTATGTSDSYPSGTATGGASSSTSTPTSSAVSFNSFTAVTLLVFVSSLIMTASLL